MRIKAGWRYRAVIHGEGEFEGVLVEPAGADVRREGGDSEVVMPRWVFRLDDGTLMEVQEATLTLLDPKNLGMGAAAGPFQCPACKGEGKKQQLGSGPPNDCVVCQGEGIVYPSG
jgi:hypothetical protein